MFNKKQRWKNIGNQGHEGNDLISHNFTFNIWLLVIDVDDVVVVVVTVVLSLLLYYANKCHGSISVGCCWVSLGWMSSVQALRQHFSPKFGPTSSTASVLLTQTETPPLNLLMLYLNGKQYVWRLFVERFT